MCKWDLSELFKWTPKLHDLYLPKLLFSHNLIVENSIQSTFLLRFLRIPPDIPDMQGISAVDLLHHLKLV